MPVAGRVHDTIGPPMTVYFVSHNDNNNISKILFCHFHHTKQSSEGEKMIYIILMFFYLYKLLDDIISSGAPSLSAQRDDLVC